MPRLLLSVESLLCKHTVSVSPSGESHDGAGPVGSGL